VKRYVENRFFSEKQLAPKEEGVIEDLKKYRGV